MTETKIKKLKKKKKTKKVLEKRDSILKSNSDEDRLEVEGLGVLEKSEYSSIYIERPTKLPPIPTKVTQNEVLFANSHVKEGFTVSTNLEKPPLPHKQNFVKKKSKNQSNKLASTKLSTEVKVTKLPLEKEQKEFSPKQTFSTSNLSVSTLESLRWDNVMEDENEEKERIRLYKLNRRKRYLAAAQAKGLSWASSYTVNLSFQPSDDSILEKIWPVQKTVSDLSSIRNLQTSHGYGMLSTGLIEC